MKFHFSVLHQNRLLFNKMLNKLPLDLLATIPDGFRNNIWWNISHVVATQQILVYRWSDLPTRVDEQWVDSYMKGTLPDHIPTESDRSELSALLSQTVEWTKEDYEKSLFKSYQEYTTSTKVTISTVEEAIAFNNFHEGYHLGAVVSIQKVLGVFPYK